MHTTPQQKPWARRIVVLAAGTLAVATLSSVAPTPELSVASASTGPVAGTVQTADAVTTTDAAALSPLSVRPRASTTVSTAAARPAVVVAPFRFGTPLYAQWWAKRLMRQKYSWTSGAQFGCLVKLWNRESHWNFKAHNRSSGAHGIPQAMPGRKMARTGADWRTNPVTQIKWGLGYIKSAYGTPCGAWRHSQNRGWY